MSQAPAARARIDYGRWVFLAIVLLAAAGIAVTYPVWSSRLQSWLAPQPEDPQRFCFLALGDSGDSAGLLTDETPQDAVARFLAEEAAPPVGSGRGALVLHTGDVVYMTGERRLYDRNFRNLSSPITEAQPDLYIDIQNAASMLFRLERQGVDVGSRWIEIADKAEGRIGDCLSPFTLPHWMMAIAATHRFDIGGRMLEAMRTYAATAGTLNARLVADYALPISEAVLLRANGEPAAAARVMRPAIGGMYRLGGSHAQQDVLEQLFLDCAVAAGSNDDVALILARVAGRHPVPPERRMGYRQAARTLS